MNAEGFYRDRRDAGLTLAAHLRRHYLGDDPLVLALPRGGVPVATEVAESLGAPLHVFIVRKLGLPAQSEVAIGAIASGGVRLLNERMIAESRVSPAEIAKVLQRETKELHRRERTYRVEGTSVDPRSCPIIVVDDGLATGFTMRAAVAALRKRGCQRITVAVPVGARSSCEKIAEEVDLLVCPVQPEPFRAVSLWYETFPVVRDQEIKECLVDHPPRRRTLRTRYVLS